MELHVSLEGRHGLARQIYQQIRESIVAGRLRTGDRLPPTRELAARLDVSRNTVSLVYEWLVAEGLLTGRSGAGTFVASALPAVDRGRANVPVRHRAVWDTVHTPTWRTSQPRFDFGVGAPDMRLFPFDEWRRLQSRQLRASAMLDGYGNPAGHPQLREAIARHVAVARGVRCTADDVIVTGGAQQAFDLIARVLIERGAVVAVEEPGYPPPRLLFESAGAWVTRVAVDESGLDVARLPDRARLVYVTPSHQFPLGMPMTHARRGALLGWADRRQAVIIEDDYDSEFRFAGRPLETLQASDRSERVIYVGSFSKTLLPTLRLGFLIAPPSLRHAFTAASYVSSWHAPWPAQATLAAFMEKELFARHVRKMRREYAGRHKRIMHALTGEFAKWLDPIVSAAGMHVAARLHSKSIRQEGEVHARAATSGVAFDTLSRLC